MAKYKIVRTDKAESDLVELALYIAVQNSKEVANRIVNEIEQAVLQLEDMPYSGSPNRFTYMRKKGYRFLVVENYLVHYHVNDIANTVYIDRIRHGSISPKNQI